MLIENWPFYNYFNDPKSDGCRPDAAEIHYPMPKSQIIKNKPGVMSADRDLMI